MKCSVGDKVMAKWPGSSLFYHAEVISVQDDEAEVLFEEGTKMEVLIKDIKSENFFTPKKRSKSPARSRRRSRSRSPARSPSRKTSAVQNTGKSPKRSRSSSRGKRALNSSKTIVTTEKKQALIMSIDDGVKVETNSTSLRVTKSTIETNMKSVAEESYMVTRQRTKNNSTSSDLQRQINNFVNPEETTPREFGGTFGAFLTYLFGSLFTLCLLLVADKADWSITKFKQSMIPCTLKDYINPHVFAFYILFLLAHALIYALPLGHIMKGSVLASGKRLDYRISAKYALLISLLVHGGLCYYQVKIAFIHDYIFQLAVCATLTTLVINFTCYLLSFTLPKEELNPAATTGSHIYDSFMGRVFNPRIGRLFDLKIYLYRPAMLGWILLVLVEIERVYFNNDGKFQPQFAFLAVSQLVFVFMELFYDEEQCPFMFDIKNEGLGYIQLIGELVYVPFFYSLPVRYVIAEPSQLSIPHLLSAASLFCVGMFLIAQAGSQKVAFRKNPYDHNLSGYDSIPASRVDGERLLVSGLWGKLRHPNYLGEILIALSWAIACGFKHVIVWVYPLYLTGLLMHRSVRVDNHSSKKHGLSWQNYCSRVKYRIIPGIF